MDKFYLSDDGRLEKANVKPGTDWPGLWCRAEDVDQLEERLRKMLGDDADAFETVDDLLAEIEDRLIRLKAIYSERPDEYN